MNHSSTLIASRYSREEVASAITAAGGPRLQIGDRIPGGATGAWRAFHEDGEPLVLKLLTGDRHSEDVRFQSAHLPTLAKRGVPVPQITSWGTLSADASYLIYPLISGQAAESIDEALLEEILRLIELQAEAGVMDERRDWNRWIYGVVFGDWTDWWRISNLSIRASLLCKRLREWIAPANGVVVVGTDFIHTNFHQGQVLVDGGRVSGIDWDHFALGSRAIDVGSLFVSWHVLHRIGAPNLIRNGGKILAERIIELVGDFGLRQIIGYHILAGCWFWRGDQARFSAGVEAGFEALEALNDSSKPQMPKESGG